MPSLNRPWRNRQTEPEVAANSLGQAAEFLWADVGHLGDVAKATGGRPDVGEVPPDRRDGAEGQQPLERRDEEERNLHAGRPFAVPLLEDVVGRHVADPRSTDLRSILDRTLIDLKEAGLWSERCDDERSVGQCLSDHQHLVQRFGADPEQGLGDALRVIPGEPNAKIVTKDEDLGKRVLEDVASGAVIPGVGHLGVGDERDPSIVDLADHQAHGCDRALSVGTAPCGKTRSTAPSAFTK